MSSDREMFSEITDPAKRDPGLLAKAAGIGAAVATYFGMNLLSYDARLGVYIGFALTVIYFVIVAKGKPAISRAAVLAIAAAIFFGSSYIAYRVIHRPEALAPHVAEAPWIAQTFDGISMELPWQLDPTPVNFPAEIQALLASSSSWSHEDGGGYVMVSRLTRRHGTLLNLAGAAQGSIDNLRNVPGTKSAIGTKHETTLLGLPAFDTEARIEREGGGALQVHGWLVADGDDLYHAEFITAADDPNAAAVWSRLRNSVKRIARA